MTWAVLRLWLVAFIALSAVGCDGATWGALGRKPYAEQHRPIYHFTPARNWMNDPVGLVYENGEYHLFFQHNPRGREWGHMSWGHAVSTNLADWRELKIAIPETNRTMAWSGSAVVDWVNSSGFGVDGQPPLVALYTSFDKETQIQSQHIAYSNDGARSWEQYRGNPVLDAHSHDFRDPKVFWHEPTKRWVMIVAFAKRGELAFYVSQDLKRWSEASRFAPADPGDGTLECPDLIAFPSDKGWRWVLTYHFKESPSHGAGNRYVIGLFDGREFEPLHASTQPIDYGADFYASQSWSDIPTADGRRIWIGWMAHVSYAGLTPTKPWRGMLTAPRVVSLVERDGAWRVRQSPVAELEALRTSAASARAVQMQDAEPLPLPDGQVGALDMELVLSPGDAEQAGVAFRFANGREVVVGYDSTTGVLFIDRSRSGDAISADFLTRHMAPVRLTGGALSLRLLLDRSSIEVFAQDGEAVITDLIFPGARLVEVRPFALAPSARLAEFHVWRMREMRRDGRG